MPQNNMRLSVHHVGGRSGSRGFPDLLCFEGDLINVIYEADDDCVEQIFERNRGRDSELHVLDSCLADKVQSTTFNINYDPYTSSLLETNEDYGSFYSYSGGGDGKYDYIQSETNKTVEKRPVVTTTLDEIFTTNPMDLQLPDFLSLDTQGTEYEILQGGRSTVSPGLLALVAEVGFHPTYKGQRLFGDLCELLSDMGFHFVKFIALMEASPFRGPLGLRAQGFQLQGEALFLKRIESIPHDVPLDAIVMLKKLAFISIVFSQFEYGLQCLERANQMIVEYGLDDSGSGCTYLNFLKGLEVEVAKTPEIYPQTFASRYTQESSSARFNVSADSPAGRKLKARITRRLGAITNRFRWSKFLKRWLIDGLQSKRRTGDQNSGVEAFLIQFGLENQAQDLRKSRLSQST